MTLRYEGIFGNLKKSGQFVSYQKTPEDKATPEKLNQLQIEQLASVLNEKQAFFFSNWMFEFQAQISEGHAQRQARKQYVRTT